METLKAEKLLADVGDLIQDNQHLEGRIRAQEKEIQQLKMLERQRRR